MIRVHQIANGQCTGVKLLVKATGPFLDYAH